MLQYLFTFLLSPDIDECAEGTDTCNDTTGVCNNNAGSYSCMCSVGYTGDGRTCNGKTLFKSSDGRQIF